MDPSMTAEEKRAYAQDGYVLRPRAFGPEEIAELRAAAEDVAARVRAHATRPGAGPERRLPDGHRIQFSSRSAIQWEWREGSSEIRLVEPVAHLHPRIEALFGDPRLAAPMRDALGCAELAPFTSKLNLKRGREGSEFPFHQDYPYWFVRIEERAAEVATAMLLLDDARESNGALRVLPGSQRGGPAPRDPQDPSRFLADPRRLDARAERVIEAPAGSLLFFGSLLVHRSSANTSGADRRALLLSFQPAGRAPMQDTPHRPDWVERLP
jgi:ectoine hydroxylase